MDANEAREPLWSDDRISSFSGNAPNGWEARRMYDAMKRVRDDYEADRAAQAAKIDDYLAAISAMASEREAIPAEVRELLGQLLKQWRWEIVNGPTPREPENIQALAETDAAFAWLSQLPDAAT